MSGAATLAEAAGGQPAVLATLAADLAGDPTHAYLFTGPAGAGKRRAARVFAAELLAAASADPESARKRALADPSPHPDLEWVSPPGNQHLVSTIRERVITAAPYSPFEGGRRVFVIEGAEALAEESQNGLLTTLEEPPEHAHLILISSDPAAILATVRSRCRSLSFTAPAEGEIAERVRELISDAGAEECLAIARLSGGDGEAATLLASETGRRLRLAAEACASPDVIGGGERPWLTLIDLAGKAGERAGEQVSERAGAEAGEAADERLGERIRREGEDAAKRAVRRERTRVLVLALRVWTARLRDIEAAKAGAGELLGCDRTAEIHSLAERVEAGRASAAAALVAQAHRRLLVNVSEELALESLAHTVARRLS